jgi:CubicO group peptidase (beta-lactamase class C family)
MAHTFFNPKPQWKKMIAPSENDPWRGRLLRGEVHDENAFAMGGVSAHAGLFGNTGDLAIFCQMLLNGGSVGRKRYLSAEAMNFLSTPQTGDMPVGFFQSETFGNHGKNYGWGIGTCVLKEPHEGVAEMLSPGSFGHGGAWGTQAWVDPVKGVAYVLMVQRSNFPNSDASIVRREFQKAAREALK